MKTNKIIEYIVVAVIVLGWTYLIVMKEILPKNIGFISLVILSIVLYFVGKRLNGKHSR
ncbi:hypothetical protein BSX36_04140 [Listeria monocytogenes]|uniref:hypothetical protein n=1 Tax=Listeria monocytogenes TaxID=1639 RepID=UPI0010B246DA|nr:hypothetical protein [Listeria monocytogenes]EAC9871374.1 hypothetical protein [Listeria monocytogenes]EAE6567944.1 hypothetical protein [Listeria monocytogenes]EAE8620113.1 hypothetical protein [Listeria monocytogenes]EAE8622539.1 hypothetical protein [Listeria monocytogenes]EAE8628175.1 hypothetical protein [Listeria monocytogenes]